MYSAEQTGSGLYGFCGERGRGGGGRGARARARASADARADAGVGAGRARRRGVSPSGGAHHDDEDGPDRGEDLIVRVAEAQVLEDRAGVHVGQVDQVLARHIGVARDGRELLELFDQHGDLRIDILRHRPLAAQPH